MDDLVNKTSFPTTAVIGDRSVRDAWVRVEDGELHVFAKVDGFVECLVDGVKIVDWSFDETGGLSEAEVARRARVRRPVGKVEYTLEDGEVVLVTPLKSCGCGNPLKRKKTLVQARGVVVTDTAKRERHLSERAKRRSAGARGRKR